MQHKCPLTFHSKAWGIQTSHYKELFENSRSICYFPSVWTDSRVHSICALLFRYLPSEARNIIKQFELHEFLGVESCLLHLQRSLDNVGVCIHRDNPSSTYYGPFATNTIVDLPCHRDGSTGSSLVH